MVADLSCLTSMLPLDSTVTGRSPLTSDQQTKQKAKISISCISFEIMWSMFVFCQHHCSIILILTVQLWIKSPLCPTPFGRPSPAQSSNSCMVPLLLIPRLVGQITPGPHYFRTLLHRPPVHPSPFAALNVVSVAEKDRVDQHRSHVDCSKSLLGQWLWREFTQNKPLL